MTDHLKKKDMENWFPMIPNYDLDIDEYLKLNKTNWTVDPSNAALLIYDMQNYWLRRFEDSSKIIGQVARVRTACKNAGIPIIFAGARKARNHAERGVALDVWGPGIGWSTDALPDDMEISAVLAPQEDEYMVIKRKFSAFVGSDLQDILNRLNRKQLIMCGIYAHHGCMITAIDAYMRNFQVFYTGDALADFTHDGHDMALRYISEVVGQIASVSQIEEWTKK